MTSSYFSRVAHTMDPSRDVLVRCCIKQWEHGTLRTWAFATETGKSRNAYARHAQGHLQARRPRSENRPRLAPFVRRALRMQGVSLADIDDHSLVRNRRRCNSPFSITATAPTRSRAITATASMTLTSARPSAAARARFSAVPWSWKILQGRIDNA
jgi:hypothetical protein